MDRGDRPQERVAAWSPGRRSIPRARPSYASVNQVMHVLLLRPVPAQRTLRPRPVLPHRAARNGIHRGGARSARPSRHASPISASAGRSPARSGRPGRSGRHRRDARARDRRGPGARRASAHAGAGRARLSSAATPRRPTRQPFVTGDIDAVVLDDGERALPRIVRRAASRDSRSGEVPGLALPTGDGERGSDTTGDTGDVRAGRRAAAGAASRRRVAPAVRLSRASPGVAGRDGARAVRSAARSVRSGSCTRAAVRERSIDSVCRDFASVGDPRLRRRRSVLVPPGAQPRAGARAAAARHPQGMDPGAEPRRSRRAPCRSCSRRGGRSRGNSTSFSASRRRPTRG